MSGPADERAGPRPAAGVLLAVGLVGAALIAYEIVLMRRLLLERWHHFGYLVISLALLGFGISGTFLALLERRVRARPADVLFGLAGGLAVLLALAPRAAALLPVSARFIPADLGRQAGWWSLYWLAALAPFLCGAAVLGAALMTAGRQVGRAYAANLFGSAAGAVGAVLVVARFPPEYGLWPSVGLALAALVLLAVSGDGRGRAGGRRVARGAGAAALAGLVVAVELTWPLMPRYDEHKDAARLATLAAQGAARRVARACDPHGYVEVYESELFHDLPFLALSTAPPPMMQVLVQGDAVGSVLRIAGADEAGVMDHTLMAFPYRLLPPRPRVLLLGETGGTNVWLARRQQARETVIVQPNAALVGLLRGDGPLAAAAGHVFEGPDLRVVTADPRAFLARPGGPFDLIQIVGLEGLGLGSSGVRGLAEDHLATVGGFAACLAALSPHGVLAVSRGLQVPERENIRLLATLAEALEARGAGDAGRHIVQVRDYLGACTLALRTPLSAERRAALRAAIAELNLTPVWYDGLPPEEVNRPDRMPGPFGSDADWLHYAAREIFSPRRAAFFAEWLLDVRPPRDDRPFFWDFYKPGAAAVLRAAYGPLWLTRAELGRLFLYAALAVTGVAALLFVLLPLALVRLVRRGPSDRGRRSAGVLTLWMLAYFSVIGLGFMGIEMALISRAIRALGDPVLASAAVIGGVLLLSGLGSLAGPPLLGRRAWLAPAAVVLLALALWLGAWDGGRAGGPVGAAALLGAAGVLACALGVPLPAGLAHLHGHAPHLVPWAWGVNGVASVVATSAALVVALVSGYRDVLLLATGCYLLAAGLLRVALRRPVGGPSRSGAGW